MQGEVKNAIRSAGVSPDAAGHGLLLQNRESLSLTGVAEVENFDETQLVADTVQGRLVIQGQGLHVALLQLDSGQLRVTGRVDSLTYVSDHRKAGFWARLLG